MSMLTRSCSAFPILALIVVSGCVADPAREVRPLAEALAAGLSSDHWDAVPDHDAVRADVETVLKGMDGTWPRVETRGTKVESDHATSQLHLTWVLPSGEWAYETNAAFVKRAQGWRLNWSPSTLHPDLTPDRRLVHRRVAPNRGQIVSAKGETLAGPHPVMRLGMLRERVPPERQERTARRIAELVGVDATTYWNKVSSSGPTAFVEALVVRGSGASALPEGFSALEGAAAYPDTRILPRTRGFADELLGQVGEATAEDVQRGNESIRPGQQIGRSGLQQRYEDLLGGKAGGKVVVVTRDRGTEISKPLYARDATAGSDLVLTLDPEVQERAEAALEKVAPAASIAVIRPSTGEILALANGPGSRGAADANDGRYAPGSTFKVVTALALLRKGQSSSTPMTCNATTVVDGRRFKNYNDFPSSRLGRMTMKDAIATSCNTALIDQHQQITGPGLRDAAGSLGLGVDHDLGFPAYLGNVPDPSNAVSIGESIIGQASIQASPLAIASVAASVSAGHTVVPHLLPHSPDPSARPLSPAEAAQLRDMTRAVVSEGSANTLRGVADGAKTGTAEYGTGAPLKTHAWMIAYGDDLAVAAFVKDGDSGSATAAPLVKAVLKGS